MLSLTPSLHHARRMTFRGNTGFGVVGPIAAIVRQCGCAIEWISFCTAGKNHATIDIIATGKEHDTARAKRRAKAQLPRHGVSSHFAHRGLQHRYPTVELSGINHPALLEDLAHLCGVHGVRVVHAEGQRVSLPPANYRDGWEMMMVVDPGDNTRRFKLWKKALIAYCEAHDLICKPVRRYPAPVSVIRTVLAHDQAPPALLLEPAAA